MENRYYTPSIEEFKVGFICEMKNSSDPKYFEWEECIFKNDFSSTLDEDYCFEYLLGDINDENIRVKFLDKGNIEEVGAVIREDELWNEEGYILASGLLDSRGIEITLYYNTKSHWMLLCTSDFYVGECRDGVLKLQTSGNNLFAGVIRNISELKVLLKQLGILK